MVNILKIMSFPKMTLKIDLIDTNKIGIELLQVTVIYDKKGRHDQHLIRTDNNWTFMVSEYFACVIIQKMFIIPDRKNRESTTLTDILVFKNDKIRYEFLKSFKDALLEWSGNETFANVHRFEKTPHIKYDNNKWTIF